MKELKRKGTFQHYIIHLTNGHAIHVEEDYDLPFEKGIIAKFKKASDDTVFSVINLFGENYYIPKKSIVYIATGDVEVRE